MTIDESRNIVEEILLATRRINERTTEFERKNSDIDSKINFYTNWAWGLVWTGIAVSIIGIVFYLLKTPGNYYLNLLGDFIGGSVASVWSLAGLFLIYVAFLGQKQQLLNQQIEIMYSQLELKYTRMELEGQKKEMMKQNQTLQQQKFENTFFQLLRTQNEIVNAMDLRNERDVSLVIAEGRDCFKIFYQRFNSHIFHYMRSLQPKEYPDLKKASIKDSISGYYNLFNEYQSDLGHYFRNLYHTVKFVDNSDIDNKKRYTNFLRAQLSSYELVILFYNCISDFGKEKFKPLIEKYSLMKNMNTDLVFNQNHLSEYNDIAYR